jgi:hypothetical protein
MSGELSVNGRKKLYISLQIENLFLFIYVISYPLKAGSYGELGLYIFFVDAQKTRKVFFFLRWSV